MKREDLKKIASATAAQHMEELLTAPARSEGEEQQSTVHARVFRVLLKECSITPEQLRERLKTWSEQKYDGQAGQLAAASNLAKEAEQPVMSEKTFRKLVRIIFPAE